MNPFDIDYTFYYGTSDINEETQHDLMQLLVQPKRQLFYSRSEGAGVVEKSNYPNAISLQIGLRYDIANAIASRNQQVTNGANGTRDRRVASSQFAIEFNQDDSGNMDVVVNYFMYSDFNTPKNVSLPVGGI